MRTTRVMAHAQKKPKSNDIMMSSLESAQRRASSKIHHDTEEEDCERYSKWFKWYLWFIAREQIPDWDHRRRVRAKAKDLVIYLLFMLLAFITAISSQEFLNPFDIAEGEQDHFFFAQSIKDQLTRVEISAEYVPNTAKTFLQITTVEDFYQWSYSAMHRTLFEKAGTFDAQDTKDCDQTQFCVRPGETLGSVYIFGAVRIGQLRAKKRQECLGDFSMMQLKGSNSSSLRCFGNAAGKFTYGGGLLDGDTEETDDFGYFNLTGKPFAYDGIYTEPKRRGTSIKVNPRRERVLPFSEYLSSGNYWYPSPAYNIILDPRRATADENMHILKALAASHYVDLQTRAIFVDCIFFNPSLHLFTKARMLLELTRSGGARPSYYADTVKLFYDLPSSQHTFSEVVIWILRFFGLGSFYFYYMLQCLEEMRRMGLFRYLRHFLKAAQLMNVIVFMSAWVLRLYAALRVLPRQARIEPFGSDYDPRFQTAIRLIRHATCLEAMNAFLNWFKLITYLSIAPSFALLTKTLTKAIGPLISFCYVFVVVFYGFAQAHSMIFHDRLFEFRTLSASSFTLLRSLLGDFDFEALHDAEQFWGPVFFIVFVSLANFIILNTVIAIIADSYQEVDIEMKNDAAELHARGLRPDAEARELIEETQAIALEAFMSIMPTPVRRRFSASETALMTCIDDSTVSRGSHKRKDMLSLQQHPEACDNPQKKNMISPQSYRKIFVAIPEDVTKEEEDEPSLVPAVSIQKDESPASSEEDQSSHDEEGEDEKDETDDHTRPTRPIMRRKRKKAVAMSNLSAARISPALQFEKLAALAKKIEEADPVFFPRLVDATEYDLELMANIFTTSLREAPSIVASQSDDPILTITEEQFRKKSRIFSAAANQRSSGHRPTSGAKRRFSSRMATRTSAIFKNALTATNTITKTKVAPEDQTPSHQRPTLRNLHKKVPSPETVVVVSNPSCKTNASTATTHTPIHTQALPISSSSQDLPRGIDDKSIPVDDELYFDANISGLFPASKDKEKSYS